MSSSASSARRSYLYDVFLSYVGSFFKVNTFGYHLYTALHQQGIRVSQQSSNLSVGLSKSFIIVFSKKYVSSSRCLAELVEIMECHKLNDQTVYPVFYDLDPAEVRSGKFKKVFAKHNKEEDVEKWREALKEAGNLAVGWDLKSFDGNENLLIKTIVEQLFREILPIKNQLVGMEPRIEKVLSLLETGIDDVCMIGIKGIGGGGKTTLARAVFDQISTQFKGKSFVEDVRGVLQAPLCSLQSLQEQVLMDLLNDQCLTVSSVRNGENIMKNLLTSRKVLVVLDNVNHIDQLKALAGSADWFGPGSRIIVTTSDERVLDAHRVTLIHHVDLLSTEEAMLLFGWNAFGSIIPTQGYTELSHQIVRYFDGVPLTIKVLGSFLGGKHVHEWEDAMISLETFPLKGNMGQLELSYIDLEADVKDVFLDVACLLKGLQKDDVIRIVESCGFSGTNGLMVLEGKCLITFSDDQRLVVHPLIEEMGKDIVRRLHPDEPNRHSRLWLHDEIEYILANGLGTETTVAIGVDNPVKLCSEAVTKGFGSMRKLRLLRVVSEIDDDDYDEKIGEIRHNFPNSLQFLRWEGYPYPFLPKAFEADNLVALEMPYSKIVRLWKGRKGKVLYNLKFLNLGHSLLKTLDLQLTPNLKRLDLEDCNHLVRLHTRDIRSLEFINLRHSGLRTLQLWGILRLERLDLEGCNHLEELHMPLDTQFLKFLNLRHSRLSTLGIQEATKLERLDLEGCNNLVQLWMPSDLIYIKFLNLKHSQLTTLDLRVTPGLEFLDLEDCNCMVELHSPIGWLRCLVYLNLSGCTSIESFVFIKRLKTLEVLSLTRLYLKKFPDIISWPNSLLELRFSYNDIKELPSAITNLRQLVLLDLSFCTKLRRLPKSICYLQQLRNLKLYGCPLGKLPQKIGRMKCLEKLNLSFARIKQLPDSIRMLKHLKTLNLSSCWNLEKLPQDLGQLERLQKLILTECAKLRDIPDDICALKILKHLNLQDCVQIEKLPKGFKHLQSLKVLNVKGTCITHLPRSILSLTGLQIYGLD